MKLKNKLKLQDILSSFDTGENLTKLLHANDLNDIAQIVIEDYKRDKSSRSKWEENIKEGMKLALQVAEAKNTPWKNASNVKFPLITVPCLQFSSRVYPALISGTDIVKVRTIGEDATGEKTARARRVSQHLSYQFLEEDEEWESQMDELLVTLPLVGCAFKKTYFDSKLDHNCSKHVFAKDLVINYYAKSLESASCITHVFTEYKNEIVENIRSGIYRDIKIEDIESNYVPDTLDQEKSEREGITQEGEKPFETLEQCRWLDLDQDGYEEPYVVTVNVATEKVCRIYPRFTAESVKYTNGEVSKINPIHYYTRYLFVPSPDGSIYGLGFFALLGPINKSVNTLINQLIDAGSLAVRGGGFIGRGARLNGGKIKFEIGQWKQVNVSGDDLRQSFFPFPAKEPSGVLFQLLSLLIEYGERVSSVSDMMVGQTPGQNTPAITSMAALEQGEKVFTGIFKRVHRAMKEEFRKGYALNKIYLNPEQYYAVLDTGDSEKVFQIDYMGDPTDIRPAADPNVISTQQRLAKVEALANRPYHGYDRFQIEKRFVHALQIEAPDEVLPPQTIKGPDGQDVPNPKAPPPPSDPKIEIEKQKLQVSMADKADKQDFSEKELIIKQALAEADIGVKKSQAMLNLAKAEAEENGPQIEIYKLQLEDLNSQRDNIRELINERERLKGMETASGNGGSTQVPQ